MGDDEDGYEKVLVLPLSEDSKKVAKALSNDTSMKILDLLAQKPMSATAIAEDLGLALTTVKYNLDTLIESDLIKVKETRWSRKGREIKIYDPVQKLIVVAPGRSDRSSIIGMLQKYLGMVAGAIFAAAGVEYLARSANIGAVPQTAMEAELALMKEAPAAMAMNDTMYEAPRMAEEMAPMVEMAEEMESLTGSASVGSNGTFYEEAMVFDGSMNDAGGNIATSAVESLQNNVSVPPEIVSDAVPQAELAASSQGLIPYDLTSHVGVWFFFGCMFIIMFLLIREVYNRKKSM